MHGSLICVPGGMYGRGHAWQVGVHGRGASMADGHAHPTPHQILRDTVVDVFFTNSFSQ